MARVTDNDVYDILDSDVTISDRQMAAMINAASLMIDETFANSNVSTDLLTEMERWLTAHLIVATLSRMAQREKVGQAEITYTGQWGEGFNSTPYGQTLLTLDPTGELAKVGKASIDIYAVPNFKE